jgi:AcrR family transcriptional regulator
VRREQARDRILRATVDTLAQQGYAGTTARAIALRGGFAPGVIYYHYTDLDDLFRQTMRFVSDGRMDRYREQVVGVTSAVELLERLRVLHDEDVASGHISAVQELIAGGSEPVTDQIRTEVRRWQDLAEEVIGALVAQTPFAPFIPVRQAAEAVIAFYLGLEMLQQIDVDPSRTDAFFASAQQAAVFFDTLRATD